jgi:ubiquitin
MGISLGVDMTPKVQLDKGIYTGTVKEIKSRLSKSKDTGEEFEYVDIYFALDGRKDGAFPKEAKGQLLKYGAPKKVSAGSKLAALLVDAGVELVTGQPVDLDVLIGKRAELIVVLEPWTSKEGKKMKSAQIDNVEFISK